VLAVRNGRHAIDVYTSGKLGIDFVPNDIFAAPYQNYIVLSGINGSGKSTYLRQIAIIVILGHCGSYVPAEDAFIPVRDRLLTRIGTTDDQEHNISTFMLEMKETAFICDQATDKSLVLIDELGRATSNEDGVAIAWAVSAFFVTHHPQLSKLAEVYPNVQNQHLSATAADTGYGEQVQYFHKVSPGPCQLSGDYGVEMAGTCGWPIDVVRHAKKMHSYIEKNLPESSLCKKNKGPNTDLLELQVRAERILTDIAKHLIAMKESQCRLTKEAKRSYLQELRNRLVPNDPALMNMMMSILEQCSEM
jgi:DNA mismatch repair ATPase MutS